MDYNERLKELQEEIDIIKDIQHNNGMKGAAKSLQKERNNSSNRTSAEKIFAEIAALKKLKLKQEYRIDIISGRKIVRFYFADFCDPFHKIVFEIDGAYHLTEEQQRKDKKRTKDLIKMGYKVFRISNEEVFNGKTTEFLIKTYKRLGIKI